MLHNPFSSEMEPSICKVQFFFYRYQVVDTSTNNFEKYTFQNLPQISIVYRDKIGMTALF